MRMRFFQLQDNNKKANKLRLEKLRESLKDIEKMRYYQGFLYVSKVIYSKLINKHHNNFFIT